MYYNLHRQTSTAFHPFCNFKAGLLSFYRSPNFAGNFAITLIFNIMPFFLPPPPHPISARYGKNQQKMATLYRSRWACSKYYTLTPVSCAKVCNSKEPIMNPTLECREAENMCSVCKSVQRILSSTGQKARFTRQPLFRV